MNSLTREKGEDLIKLVEWQGETYLFYKRPMISTCVLSCSTADEKGNVTTEKELTPTGLSMAISCKTNGGRVIVQVKRYTQAGTLNSRMVTIPHIFVDHVVLEKPEHRLFRQFPEWGLTELNPAWTGEIRVPLETLKPMPHGLEKVAARVALECITPGSVVNFGFGLPSSVMYIACTEENMMDLVTSALEIGIIGGVPGIEQQFALCTNADAVIPSDYMFDNIWGGGIDHAFLSFGEIDEYGNVNVSRFGNAIIGPGGFIDISHNAKNLCFLGTFTSGVVEADCAQGQLKIRKDGTVLKFKKRVQEITFNSRRALSYGERRIRVATERALFEVTEDGLILTKIAPGIDLEKDILEKMEFRPLISRDLKTLDHRIYRPEPIGIREKLLAERDEQKDSRP